VKARIRENRVTIICPACREIELALGYTGIAGEHEVPFTGDTRPGAAGWHFNGDLERPTLSPSLNRTCEYGGDPKKLICHSFVRNGQIQYLGDCTHRFAGQTVDLPEISPATTVEG
jgi:hypothetical protein